MKLLSKSPAEKVFKDFCEAYKNRDLQSLLNLFTEETNMWGSALDEYRVGLKEVEEQLMRDWGQSEKGEIEIVSFVPSPADALWAAAICKAKIMMDGVEHMLEHLRGTIIVEKEDGVWKISHMHASFPDFRNPENSSFPV